MKSDIITYGNHRMNHKYKIRTNILELRQTFLEQANIIGK